VSHVFHCEEGPHPVFYPDDRIVVSLDLMTANGKERVRRIQIRRMCREHALAWVKDMDLKPHADQLGLW
jgi:hypothetical protein